MCRTDGELKLTDGPHVITVRQEITDVIDVGNRNGEVITLVSAESDPIILTVDTTMNEDPTNMLPSFATALPTELEVLARIGGTESSMTNPEPDIEAIFNAARNLPTPQERAAYLMGVCGDDVRLRKRVEALLQSDEGARAGLPGKER